MCSIYLCAYVESMTRLSDARYIIKLVVLTGMRKLLHVPRPGNFERYQTGSKGFDNNLLAPTPETIYLRKRREIVYRPSLTDAGTKDDNLRERVK